MFRWVKIYITLMVIQQIIPALNLMAAERDPFVSILDLEEQQKATAKKTDLSKMVLKGIIWNEYKPIAIVNDELVMIGDYWQGLKVEAIEKDSVTLKDQDESFKLFIEEPLPSGIESLATMKLPESDGQEGPIPPAGIPGPGEEKMFPPEQGLPLGQGGPGAFGPGVENQPPMGIGVGPPEGLGPQGEGVPPGASEVK